MFLQQSPLFSREEDSSGSGSSFSSEARLKLISDCALTDENIKNLLIPSLFSSERSINEAALTKIHGRGNGEGISAEQSKKFGVELKNSKLQNPKLHDLGMIAYSIARAETTEAAELLCEILKYQTAPLVNQDPTITISAICSLKHLAACVLEPLKTCLQSEDYGFLAERAITDINKSISLKNAECYTETNYRHWPLTKAPALEIFGNREQTGKWVDSHLRFTLDFQDRNSCCRIRVFTGERDQTIVLFSADELSYGDSPTEVIEQLASYAVRAFNLDPCSTTFVEHYEPSYGNSATEEVSIISKLRSRDSSNILRDPSWILVDNPQKAWKLLESLGFKEEWL